MRTVQSFPCPHCGQSVSAPSTQRSVRQALPSIDCPDIDGMTDAQLFAYRKRTALPEDLRFFLRAGMSPALRARAEAVTKPTKPIMASLYAAWRMERSEMRQGYAAELEQSA